MHNNEFDVTKAVLDLDMDGVVSWVKEELAAGTGPYDIIAVLTIGLENLGEKFAAGEVFIPELAVGGNIFKAALLDLDPAMKAAGITAQKTGVFIVGTVKGDLHDIGQNIVGVTMMANGFEVHNLGANVPIERFIEVTRDLKPDIVGMSALLTTTMEVQGEVCEALKAEGLRDSVKVMVGGAPVNQRWADEIGADAYGIDAIDAVKKAKVLMGVNK
jgi:corrinoid protein of di/trimethylamine methyltransferase